MNLQLDADLQANTILHIGFSKCASKTLQNLFTVHEALTCINFHHALDLLISKPGFPWDGERAHRAFTQLFSEARDLGTIPVISHERLTGIYDTIEIANRLHALMPRARVLICIREQIGMLASQYKHAVRHGCTRTVAEYLMTPWNSDIPALRWEFFQYRQVVALYQSLFGKNRVCVKLVEELRDSPQAFYEDLYRFLGVEPSDSIDIHEVHHPGISDLETARRRLLNFFSEKPSELRDPNPLQGQPINEMARQEIEQICAEMSAESVPSIKAEVRALFQGRFAESNQALSELIGVDLSAYGYEVAPGIANSAESKVSREYVRPFALEPMDVGMDYQEHKILKYRGILYALPYARSAEDLRGLSLEARAALLHDRNLNALKRKILTELDRVRVVDEAYRDFRIVRQRERYYAIPQAVGVVDATRLKALTETSSTSASLWYAGDSETECRAWVDDLTTLRWLAQHPAYQPLYGELTDFVAAPDEQSAGLFHLPPAETWAIFRLLWHGLSASLPRGAAFTPGAELSLDIHAITDSATDATLLDCATQSSATHPWSFSAYASWAQGVMLRETPADIQIALTRSQLECAQGNWENAGDLLFWTIDQVQPLPGGFAATLPHLAALMWVHRLFPEEALGTQIAQRAFAFLRDVATSFLHTAPIQQALVRSWQEDTDAQASGYMRLGEALFAMDRLTGAEAAFRAASDLTPESASVHNDLAVIYWCIARQTQESPYTRQALVHLGRALVLDPTNTDVLVNAQTITSGLELVAA